MTSGLDFSRSHAQSSSRRSPNIEATTGWLSATGGVTASSATAWVVKGKGRGRSMAPSNSNGVGTTLIEPESYIHRRQRARDGSVDHLGPMQCKFNPLGEQR